MKFGYFFFSMAILFIAVALAGFVPSFTLMHRGGLKVHWLTHVHSGLMSSWLLLFSIQSGLVASGNTTLHRRLGIFGFAVGCLVIVAMITVSVHILVANQPPETSFLFDLLVTEFYSIIGFTLFFIWGMRKRKSDPAVHKRALFFGTIFLLIAAIDRISWLPQFNLSHRVADFLYEDLIFLCLFAYDLAQSRHVYKFSRLAAVIMLFLQTCALISYDSPAWHHFWFRASAPLVSTLIEVQLSDAQTGPLLGKYQGDPFGTLTIGLDSGRLFLQIGGDKQTLGARSENELFTRNDVMNFYFIRGSGGKIIRVRVEEIGRQFYSDRVR